MYRPVKIKMLGSIFTCKFLIFAESIALVSIGQLKTIYAWGFFHKNPLVNEGSFEKKKNLMK